MSCGTMAARFAKLNRCGPDLENQSIDEVKLISNTCSYHGKEKKDDVWSKLDSDWRKELERSAQWQK